MIEYIEDLVFCDTCKEYTNQLRFKQLQDLVRIGNFTILEKFKCNVCQRINERVLHFCDCCQKHTRQSLISEQLCDIFSDLILQKFRCKECEYINDRTRNSDEFIERFLNAKNEKDGVYCNYCLSYKKQILLDKKQSDLNAEFDLTTYKCKSCGGTNYGMLEKKDVI